MSMSKINSGMRELAKHFAMSGIDKDGTNKQQNYKFRGIDRVLNEFSGPLASAGLTLIPSFSHMDRIVQKTKSGEGWLVTLQGTFRFVADDDSERVVGPFYGEAFDSMDKAVSKAQSVSFRNAMLLTFCVPLGAAYDPDADGDGDDNGDFPENEPEPQDQKPAGMFGLSAGQEKWLMGKAGVAGIDTKEQLLRNFRRIDKDNAADVGAKLADPNFKAKP
jgi:hypothetical protein